MKFLGRGLEARAGRHERAGDRPAAGDAGLRAVTHRAVDDVSNLVEDFGSTWPSPEFMELVNATSRRRSIPGPGPADPAVRESRGGRRILLSSSPHTSPRTCGATLGHANVRAAGWPGGRSRAPRRGDGGRASSRSWERFRDRSRCRPESGRPSSEALALGPPPGSSSEHRAATIANGHRPAADPRDHRHHPLAEKSTLDRLG